MKLNITSLKSQNLWHKAGFSLPEFDIRQMVEQTKKTPQWVHFGAGNIFRALLANAQQTLLNHAATNTGIVAVGSDSIKDIYQRHDNLTILVTMKSNGEVAKTVIGSVAETLVFDKQETSDWARLNDILVDPGLQIISFTITEKGYKLQDPDGEYLAEVRADFAGEPEDAISYMGKIAGLLYERYQAGGYPISLVSLDNISRNGSVLADAITTFAKAWNKPGFLTYLLDSGKVAFPWTMIDKITPRPNEAIRQMLQEAGLAEVQDIITARGSYVSPFVNAEEAEYLVIEENFPNGRPPLEKAGIIFADRATVEKVERMKVTTCLNPLHTALAIFGCLLGYQLISDEMQDPDLKRLVERIGYEEGFPVVVDPGIIRPLEFLNEVLRDRLSNPFILDTPHRIATDTSQKLAIRFGETIKAYQASDTLNVADLQLIPLVLAGWIRYLVGVDDDNQPIELSSDPMLDELRELVKEIRLGDKGPFHDYLQPILSNQAIFGVDLYSVGLGERVEDLFGELISDIGAVRKTLKKYVHR